MYRKLWLAGFAMVGLGLAGAAPALATPVPTVTSETFIFTSDHCTGGCLMGQSNGGTVTVTNLGSGVLSFSVALSNGNQFINSGFDASFGFNLAGNPTITYGSVLPVGFTIPGVIPVDKQAAGSLHMDGTGFFDYGLEAAGHGGSDPNGSTLSFTVSGTGLTLASLEKNANGQYFAADIISGTSGNTGGIDVSGDPIPAPEPTSLALLGFGLAGLGGAARRRRKHTNAA